jgi:DNA-directed RNA polymerase subunit N (RpoN/RPB10)
MEPKRCPSCGKLLVEESKCLCTITWINVDQWRAFEKWMKEQEELEEKFRRDFRISK